MYKKIVMILAAFLVVFIGCIEINSNSKAYTDEQKAQAKAWLSAHGYSPDAGGAAAAYQDYLNGKFDEELGITRETTEATQSGTQSAYEEPDSKDEKTTEENHNNDIGTGSIWEMMGQGMEQDTEQETSDTVSSTEEISKIEPTTEIEPSTQIAYEEPEEADEEETKEEENKGEITMYLSENADKYKEAVTVVLLGILAVAIAIGAKTLIGK